MAYGLLNNNRPEILQMPIIPERISSIIPFKLCAVVKKTCHYIFLSYLRQTRTHFYDIRYLISRMNRDATVLNLQNYIQLFLFNLILKINYENVQRTKHEPCIQIYCASHNAVKSSDDHDQPTTKILIWLISKFWNNTKNASPERVHGRHWRPTAIDSRL